MGRPYALLRIGFPYEKTLGMRRLTNTPVDLAVGSDGHLHILCRGEGVTFVRRLTMDDEDMGSFNLRGGGAQIGGTSTVSVEFIWPACLVMDADENLWFADEGTNKITALTKQGEVVSHWGESGDGKGQLNRPACLAFDPEGNVYVSDTMNHRVQKFTKDGKLLMKWGGFGCKPGEFNMPWGVAVDELGDVYVADWRNDRVQKFTSDGEFVFEFGRSGCEDGSFNRPSGVCVDGDGDIYVADWGNHRVQLFGSDGRFVEKFVGDATMSLQARNYMMTNLMALRLREMTAIEPQKRLRWPVSVRVDGKGRMYVPDYGSHRVQIYQKEVCPLGPGEIAPPLRNPTLYTQF